MRADGTVTWRELLEETAAVVGARNEARWLCEEASGYFGSEFHEVLDQAVTKRSVAHLDAMVARVRTGEPLQYVLGHWSFRELDLMVDPRVLIPRPETELIVDLAKKAMSADAHGAIAVDLGTGSGAIGLALAMELPRGSAEIWITDSSRDALEVASANLAGLGVRGNNVHVALGDWYEALPHVIRGRVALIVSNPPYIAAGDSEVEKIVSDYEPHGALFAGSTGLEDLTVIINGSREWLSPNGALVVEIGHRQGSEAKRLATEAGFADVTIHQDLTGKDRFLTARLKG
jgi:release factor glutamine methyltransferase